jgi:hypothetical protein
MTPNCRDEVLVALDSLIELHGDRPFAVREVYAEMVANGTTYAELTVFKAMQTTTASPSTLRVVGSLGERGRGPCHLGSQR